MIRPKVLLAVVVALTILSSANTVHAQVTHSAPDFIFENFAGTYYLDRNSKGTATLTVQENMTVYFPSDSNLYGIERALPETYQDHSLNLKIISVTDAAGNPIQYKQVSDGKGNLLITTGDPDIILNGLQTYQIKYQTSGVSTTYPGHDEFLVDVNGRQWQEHFNSVKAFINIAKSFSNNLVGRPSCYVGYQNKTFDACTIKYEPRSDGVFVESATTKILNDHTALVVKLDFKKGTFNKDRNPTHNLFYLIIGLLAAGLLSLIIHRRSSN